MAEQQSSRSTRREFLQGKAAVRAVGDVIDAVHEHDRRKYALPANERENLPYLVRFARAAMACQFEVMVNAEQYSRAGEAAIAALDLVDRLEDLLSVYRPTSEISRLNALAGELSLRTGDEVWELLQLALRLAQATGGAFDATAGPLVECWGFLRRSGRVPSEAELADARARSGFAKLRLDEATRQASFAGPGMAVNLGAIGQGYALDRGAALLAAAGVQDFVFHGGQSSVLARGTQAGRSDRLPGWTVGLVHPLKPQQRLAEFRLVDRALGTSGAGGQFFLHQGRRYGHILDPRTGIPAEGVLSATVLAESAALADALSTAFYVLGPDAAAEFCAAHPEWNVSALLVVPSRQGDIELRPIALTDDRWRDMR